VVFRDGPNANHFRFRHDDLAGFGESFAGQPFLRNHDTGDIRQPDGIVSASIFDGDGFLQTIELTTERGMRSFVDGQIDRFSIGWNYSKIICSICGSDWLEGGCTHWPGKTYDGVTCELIFEGPRGTETSAVNVPAVDGTGVLAQLCEQKEQKLKQEGLNMEENVVEIRAVEEATTSVTAEPAPEVGAGGGAACRAGCG